MLKLDLFIPRSLLICSKSHLMIKTAFSEYKSAPVKIPVFLYHPTVNHAQSLLTTLVGKKQPNLHTKPRAVLDYLLFCDLCVCKRESPFSKNTADKFFYTKSFLRLHKSPLILQVFSDQNLWMLRFVPLQIHRLTHQKILVSLDHFFGLHFCKTK